MIKTPTEDLVQTYVVESILDHRRSEDPRGGFDYRVKWTGYSHEHDTWEHETQFQDHKIISDYMQEMRRLGKVT